jgi:hypothetical protein
MLEAGTKDSDDGLSRLSLARGPGACDLISSNLGPEQYALCPIVPRT